MKTLLRFAAAFLVMALCGCSSLLQRPVPELYRLTSARAFGSVPKRIDVRLLVLRPRAAPGLDTERIALTRPPLAFDYFAGSAWLAPLPQVVRRALVLSFEKSGALTAGNDEQTGLDQNFFLECEISHFEADYGPSPGPPLARVSLRVWLVRQEGKTVVASATFESRQPAAVNDVPHVVLALDQAFDTVAQKIVSWVAHNAVSPAQTQK